MLREFGVLLRYFPQCRGSIKIHPHLAKIRMVRLGARQLYRYQEVILAWKIDCCFVLCSLLDCIFWSRQISKVDGYSYPALSDGRFVCVKRPPQGTNEDTKSWPLTKKVTSNLILEYHEDLKFLTLPAKI